MGSKADFGANTLIAHSLLSGEELIRFVQDQYGLRGEIDCALFAVGVNDIYRVWAGDRKYVLRVSHAQRFGRFNEDAYRFELSVMRFLREQNFPVPNVILNVEAKPLVPVVFPEGVRYLVLFDYAAGQPHAILTPDDAALMGVLLARLHHTLDHFEATHRRFELDEAFLLDEPMRYLRQVPEVTGRDLPFLENLAQSLKATMRMLPRTAEMFAPIHGDYWWSNMHFDGQGLTLFDFDFCGNGWRLYDIATFQGTARANGFKWPDDVVEAFLEGYESVRPLTDIERNALQDFEAIRVIWALGLAASQRRVNGDRWFTEFFQRGIRMLKPLAYAAPAANRYTP